MLLLHNKLRRVNNMGTVIIECENGHKREVSENTLFRCLICKGNIVSAYHPSIV